MVWRVLPGFQEALALLAVPARGQVISTIALILRAGVFQEMAYLCMRIPKVCDGNGICLSQAAFSSRGHTHMSEPNRPVRYGRANMPKNT